MKALANASSLTPNRTQSPTKRAKFTVNDLLFVNAYLGDCERVAWKAYKLIHPHVTQGSAEVKGSQQLNKVEVQAEIARRLTYHGITREMIETDLLWCRDQARAQHDYEAVASVSMDCAKLAGLLIEKREEVSPTLAYTVEEITQELRKRAMLPN